VDCRDQALVQFTLLSDMRKTRSKVRSLNFRKANFQLLNEIPPGKWFSGTGGQNRAGRSLRMLSTERQSSRSPGVYNRIRKGRDWHG